MNSLRKLNLAQVNNNFLKTGVREKSDLHKADFDIMKKSVIYIICDKFLRSGARNIKATIDIRKILEK